MNFKSVDSLPLDKSYLYTFSTTAKPKNNTTVSKHGKNYKFTFSAIENRLLTDLDGTPKIYLQTYLKQNQIKSIKLVGDFNDWETEKNKYTFAKVKEDKYEISLSEKQFHNKPNFTFLINEEFLLQPNYRDENVDYQPNYKYFSIPQ